MRTLVVLLALSRVTALPAALPGASVTLPSGLGSPPLADAPTVDSPETDALAPDALAPEAPADDSPPPPPPGSELFAAETPPPPPPPGGDGDAADLVSNLASAPPAVAPAFGRIGRGWLQQRGAAVAAAASCALCAGGAWTARARARALLGGGRRRRGGRRGKGRARRRTDDAGSRALADAPRAHDWGLGGREPFARRLDEMDGGLRRPRRPAPQTRRIR